MDPPVDAYVAAAICWLVQTILATLLIDKQDAWIRRVNVQEDVKKLKSEIRNVGMVVAAVKGREIGNEQLAESLATLKELLYDADDAVDELNYYRLQQHVQQVNLNEPEEGTQTAEQADEGPRGPADKPSSSSGQKRRSPAWNHYEDPKEEGKLKAKCKYCEQSIGCATKSGTSAMLTHNKICKRKGRSNDQPPNHSSTADGMPVEASSSRGDATSGDATIDATHVVTGNTSGDATIDATHVVTGNSPHRKRKRTDEESAQITTANTQTPRWNKAEWSNRIQEITHQLQEIRGDVRAVLKILGSDSAANSTLDQRLRTSSLVQRKMYGRAEEKESVIKMMAEGRAEGVTILPIVGIAGVGKTTLAQHLYNDPTVEKQFERIWVWVSHSFDEVLLTREILDFVCRERHIGSPENNIEHEGISRFSPSNQGISSFSVLQEMLKRYMKSQSKRFLLVLDDVWDNLDYNQWNKLLAPFKSCHLKGNLIIVTTRDLSVPQRICTLSVAQRIGTLEPVMLGALKHDDFSLLFKSHAFGDENYEGHQSLSIIGQKIVEKLKGNPLAAKSTGVLLREKLETDHWSSILKNEKWKSLQLDGGIMPAFKLSYDQLPYHLQQCFSYCSIFPYNYQFLDEELVRIWISQGFVRCGRSGQRLEEIGRSYLTDLVNLGFFQQVKKEESFLGSKIWYALCGLVHDFARMVSRTECATIDGLRYNEMLPTIRHLSILTDSAYSKDQDGNITRNNDFGNNLMNMVKSVRKLRTLVLVGKHGPLLFQSFQDIFQKAHHLRLLQVSATSADFNSRICSSINPMHLRYLKYKPDEVSGGFPQVLSKFYHLQVLDVSLGVTYLTAPNCLNNLVSLQHLVANQFVHSSIGRIGQMTSLQELKDFRVNYSSGFEITQLQSMNELVHLGVFQLQNVKNQEEAYGAKLRHKRHLKMLSLYWQCDDTLSEDEYDNCKEVLEGLEPNLELKHLQIYGYNGISPTWLGSNITSLQTLHLDDCGQWETLPPLERLPFLTKLKLRNMHKVIEVFVPLLEELVLENMPNLERCSFASVCDLHLQHCSQITQLLVEDEQDSRSIFMSAHGAAAGHPDIALAGSAPVDKLNSISPLKNIFIQNCPILTLTEGNEGLSRFTSLEKLTVEECSKLLLSLVHKDINDDRANGRWLLPQSLRELEISGEWAETLQTCFIENQSCLTKLKLVDMPHLKSVELHSCTALEDFIIGYCESLVTLVGLQSLGRLKCLEIDCCPRLHPCLKDLSMQGPDLFPRLSRLEKLYTDDTSLLTRSFCEHLSSLQCLILTSWNIGTTQLIDEQESWPQLLTSLQELEFDQIDELLDLPTDLSRIVSLKKLRIRACNGLSKLTGVALLTSLQELKLSFCNNLEDLPEGLHSLPSLKKLQIIDCPEIFRLPKKNLPCSLEILEIEDCSDELTEECRKLATRKLKVKIDGDWIN